MLAKGNKSNSDINLQNFFSKKPFLLTTVNQLSSEIVVIFTQTEKNLFTHALHSGRVSTGDCSHAGLAARYSTQEIMQNKVISARHLE